MQCAAVSSRGCLPLIPRPIRRLVCVPRCFTQQQHGSRPPQQQQEAKHNMAQASKDLGPYVLWDKALKLRATWDSRAHNQAELSSVLALLEEHALDRTITLDQTQGSRGEALTTLTLVCRPDDGDEVAAALLQLTPSMHISATSFEQASLPQHTVSVSTAAYGPIDMHLSLAGSRVCKASPNWRQCEKAAAEAGDGVDAPAVAAAAMQQLQAGLDDGSIELLTADLF